MPSRAPDGVPWLELSTLPTPPRSESFALEPLVETHAELDYAALMSCRRRLREELQWRGWPSEGFSLEDNRADLRRHQRELELREAFAYTVLAPDRSRCVGCVYLERCDEIGGGQLAFWVVDEALPLERELVHTVLRWVHDTFGLDQIVIPLRKTNPRGIALLRELGLPPWIARDDKMLRAHHCFLSFPRP